jgi:hypothetical protein
MLPVVIAGVGASEARGEVIADKRLLSRVLGDCLHFEVRGLGARYETHGVSAGAGCLGCMVNTSRLQAVY